MITGCDILRAIGQKSRVYRPLRGQYERKRRVCRDKGAEERDTRFYGEGIRDVQLLEERSGVLRRELWIFVSSSDLLDSDGEVQWFSQLTLMIAQRRRLRC